MNLKICLSLFLGIILFVWPSAPCRADGPSNGGLMGDLMAAEMYSFSLEDFIVQSKDKFSTRHGVYEFFRQGFGPSISEKLTDNIWNNNQVMLRPGDEIMQPAKNVSFSDVTNTSAIMSFETPPDRKHIWGNAVFTKLLIKQENERWKLFEINKR